MTGVQTCALPILVEQRVLNLADQCRGVLRGLGAELMSEGSSHYNSPIIAARWQGVDSVVLAKALREREVHVSSRYGWLRVSVHFYNLEEDLNQLAVEAKRILSALP